MIKYGEDTVRRVWGHNGLKHEALKYLPANFNEGIILELVLVEGFIDIIGPDGGEVVGDTSSN